MVVKKKIIAEDEEVVVYRNGKRIMVINKVEKAETPVESPKEKSPKGK